MIPPILLALIFQAAMISANPSGTFPTIKAQTLSGKNIELPVSGKTQLLVIAFERQAQSQADAWYKFWQQNLQSSSTSFYEVPMISTFWRWASGWIDGGMRSGVPVEKHPFVATYYGPLNDYFRQMNVKDKSKVYVFLIGPSGQILCRASGFPAAADAGRFVGALKP
jgi:hypothetical protein